MVANKTAVFPAVERTDMRVLVLGAILSVPAVAFAQKPQSSQVLIANLAKPGELDFEGGTCDRRDDRMACTFQQDTVDAQGRK